MIMLYILVGIALFLTFYNFISIVGLNNYIDNLESEIKDKLK